MNIDVLTLFPELVESVIASGMPRVAVEKNALQLQCRQLRDYSDNRWRRVDERPFGGGPGMVVQPEPLAQAVAAAKQAHGAATPVVLLSPQGEPFTQAWAQRLAGLQAVILVCGRYEGVDERFLTEQVDVELSIGDVVLSGGELAAMVVVDAVSRLLPGVLGDAESAIADSFSHGLLDHPHYTKPAQWQQHAVPKVLLSGDHRAISQWRLQRALVATWLKRPDLLAGLDLNEAQRKALREGIAEQLAHFDFLGKHT